MTLVAKKPYIIVYEKGDKSMRIGIDCDVIGDVNGYTIRDAVAIRAVSRQSTGAEVTRLNTPIHAVLLVIVTTSLINYCNAYGNASNKYSKSCCNTSNNYSNVNKILYELRTC